MANYSQFETFLWAVFRRHVKLRFLIDLQSEAYEFRAVRKRQQHSAILQKDESNPPDPNFRV